MERTPTAALTLDAARVVQLIEVLAEETPDGVLAFDADGTLWSGDVGEDVFHYFLTRSLLRDQPAEALATEARNHHLDPSGNSTELASRLFQAYLSAAYSERDACAMMTWCYAGYTLDELDVHIELALRQTGLADRLHRELETVFEFAERVNLRTIVVSASPLPVVERAAHLWGIAPRDIVAARPALDGRRLLPKLAAPVPYAEHKPAAFASLSGGSMPLATFGDNVFDIELLRAAKLAVAVRPKPALRERLADLPGVVVLAPHS